MKIIQLIQQKPGDEYLGLADDGSIWEGTTDYARGLRWTGEDF